MDSDCAKCGGRCCMGTIDVYPTDVVFNDKQLTKDGQGTGFPRIMRTNERQQCIALANGFCTIYEKRPAVCRAFEVGNRCCLNIQAGHLNSHSCGFCIVSDKLKELQLR